jgi:hypothetical protein
MGAMYAHSQEYWAYMQNLVHAIENWQSHQIDSSSQYSLL